MADSVTESLESEVSDNLNTAVFLHHLPVDFHEPSGDSAKRIIDTVVTKLSNKPLAQRQYIRLARRLFPTTEAGFHLLQEFYSENIIDVKETPSYLMGLTARKIVEINRECSQDWYFSPASKMFFSTWYSPFHFDDVGFQIFDRHENLILTAPCTIFRGNGIEYFNQPVKFMIAPEFQDTQNISLLAQRQKAITLAVKRLEFLSCEYLAYSFLVCAETPAIDEALFHSVAAKPVFTTVRTQPTIQIPDAGSSLMNSLRKSYRSLVKSGMKSYQFSYFSGGEITDEVSSHVKNLLASLSNGRFSPNPIEIDLCLEFCRAGRGDIQIAKDANGVAVGINVFIDDGASALYALGAYLKPELGPPVSHAMVFQAVFRAGERGRKRVCLSHIANSRFDLHRRRLIETSENQEGYKFFKLGFANDVRRAICYRVLNRETV